MFNQIFHGSVVYSMCLINKGKRYLLFWGRHLKGICKIAKVTNPFFFILHSFQLWNLLRSKIARSNTPFISSYCSVISNLPSTLFWLLYFSKSINLYMGWSINEGIFFLIWNFFNRGTGSFSKPINYCTINTKGQNCSWTRGPIFFSCHGLCQFHNFLSLSCMKKLHPLH